MESEKLYREARRKALGALTYRGRSAAELIAYLTGKGYSDEIATRVLKEMTRLRYVDDEALAREVIERRLRQGYGPFRIRRELFDKGFAKNLIEQLLTVLYPWEEECFQAARWLDKKEKREGRPENNRQIGRWASFLRRRGFGETAIGRAIKKYREFHAE